MWEKETRVLLALGHDYKDAEWITDKAPTCTEVGKKHQVCNNGCAINNEEDILALGHDFSGTPVYTPATCEKDGFNTYTCINANCTETKTETITTALGHDYEGAAWVIEKNPTCTEVGKRYQLCMNGCGKKNYEDIPVIEHTWGDPKHTAATCTEAGYNTITCSSCGRFNTFPAEDALGHSYAETEFVDSTCSEKGHRIETCSRCDDSIYTTIEKKDHTYGEEFVSTAPTCTTAGYDTYTCTVCSYEDKRETSQALGHDYEVTNSKEANCLEDGFIYKTCSRCSSTDTQVINALGHDWDEGEKIKATEATSSILLKRCKRNNCEVTEYTEIGSPLTFNEAEYTTELTQDNPVFMELMNKMYDVSTVMNHVMNGGTLDSGSFTEVYSSDESEHKSWLIFRDATYNGKTIDGIMAASVANNISTDVMDITGSFKVITPVTMGSSGPEKGFIVLGNEKYWIDLSSMGGGM